jgi:23S rRNA (cytidine1920-2'-O)/16S rRNA (cytidine1409-2'-O)-methyltransferase
MKKRLDSLLVERRLVENQSKAKALTIAGKVRVNTQVEYKPDKRFDISVEISAQTEPNQYVSRGGIKLQKALKEFKVDVEGKIAIDVGASTGGFTDCLLQSGAKKVYAVDVGYGQIAWKLRQDPRVVVIEKTNARYLKPEFFGFHFDLATIDVSFISLRIVLPVIAKLIKPRGDIIALIKPEFEATRKLVKKGGVVKDPSVHMNILDSIIRIAQQNGVFAVNLTYSPIKGPAGNIEFLTLFKAFQTEAVLDFKSVCQVVEEAHNMKCEV